MHVEWSKGLETGHLEIDRDHQGIVDIINRLDGLLDHGNTAEIGEILCTLTEYVIVHFGREEQLMLRTRYPRYDAHMLCHCQFFANLTRFTYAFETNARGLSRDIQEYLADWLIEHEASEDKHFVTYLNDHDAGLSGAGSPTLL